MVKEALEKAAIEAAEDCYECRYDNSHTGMRIVNEAFMYGAEWQRKQSQWISVDDRLPDVDKSGESEFVLVRYKNCIPIIAQYCTDEFHCCPSFMNGRKKCISHWIDTSSNWILHEITHWAHIPSFDEILEANKDVLKRMKEK